MTKQEPTNDESSASEDESEVKVHAVDVAEVRPMRQRYLRPGQPLESVNYVSDSDATATHYAIRDTRGVVIGIGSMHFDNRVAGVGPYLTPGARVRGLAVEESERRSGHGRSILSEMIRIATEAGIEEVWANAREGSFEFFSAMAFREVSSEFDIPDLGRHIVMARQIRRPRRRRDDAGSTPDPSE